MKKIKKEVKLNKRPGDLGQTVVIEVNFTLQIEREVRSRGQEGPADMLILILLILK